jgi:hypothetical protein
MTGVTVAVLPSGSVPLSFQRIGLMSFRGTINAIDVEQAGIC